MRWWHFLLGLGGSGAIGRWASVGGVNGDWSLQGGEREVAGQRRFNGETVVTRCFNSTPSRRGRVTIGDEKRGGAPLGRWRLRAKAGGRRQCGWARWVVTFSWAKKAGGLESH
jgi:hypothetical protein